MGKWYDDKKTNVRMAAEFKTGQKGRITND